MVSTTPSSACLAGASRCVSRKRGFCLATRRCCSRRRSPTVSASVQLLACMGRIRSVALGLLDLFFCCCSKPIQVDRLLMRIWLRSRLLLSSKPKGSAFMRSLSRSITIGMRPKQRFRSRGWSQLCSWEYYSHEWIMARSYQDPTGSQRTNACANWFLKCQIASSTT